MKRVTVYTAEPCARCGNARALLTGQGIEFDEVNLSKDPVGRAALAERTGLMTFPQVVVDGETIGGLDDLRAAAENGRLSELLTARRGAAAAAGAGSARRHRFPGRRPPA